MGGRKADLVPDLTLMVPGHHFQKGTLDRRSHEPKPILGGHPEWHEEAPCRRPRGQSG